MNMNEPSCVDYANRFICMLVSWATKHCVDFNHFWGENSKSIKDRESVENI